MAFILTDVEPWMTACALAVVMLTSWSVSWYFSKSLHRDAKELPASKFGDAILALLGLLLAFTFSISLAKHDRRREMAVTDSNAIADFYTCVSLLDSPTRGELQSLVRQYVQHRLSIGTRQTTHKQLQHELTTMRAMHGRMQELVRRSVDRRTPLVVPLVNTLNSLTSSHAARLAAVRDHLPPSIAVLLSLAAVLSMLLLGHQHARVGQQPWGALLAFTLLVALVFWVTLDLNQPQRGWIRISQEPMQQLLIEMQ